MAKKFYKLPLNEDEKHDLYDWYLEITDLINDLETLGVDTKRPLDYESFEDMLYLIKASYIVAGIDGYSDIKDYLEDNGMSANKKLTYLD